MDSSLPGSLGFSRQEDWSGLPCPPPEESSRPREGGRSDCHFEPLSSEVSPVVCARGSAHTPRGWRFGPRAPHPQLSLQGWEQGPQGYFCCYCLSVPDQGTPCGDMPPSTGTSGGLEPLCTTGPALPEMEFTRCLFIAVHNAPGSPAIHQVRSTPHPRRFSGGPPPHHFHVSPFRANSRATLLYSWAQLCQARCLHPTPPRPPLFRGTCLSFPFCTLSSLTDICIYCHKLHFATTS